MKMDGWMDEIPGYAYEDTYMYTVFQKNQALKTLDGSNFVKS